MSGASLVEQIAQDVGLLLDEVRTRASYVQQEIIQARGRKRVTTVHKINLTHHVGLLDQLEHAAIPQGSPGWDEDGAASTASRSKPGSRVPTTAAFDLLTDITAGAVALHARLSRIDPKTSRKTTPGALRSIVGLSLTADDTDVGRAAKTVRSWVTAANVLLRYEAPISQLHVVCPDCHGRLWVRSDASSDVWCAGPGRVHGPPLEDAPFPVYYGGCGAAWPRGMWLDLLEGKTGQAS